jgi:hypothetical protein
MVPRMLLVCPKLVSKFASVNTEYALENADFTWKKGFYSRFSYVERFQSNSIIAKGKMS